MKINQNKKYKEISLWFVAVFLGCLIFWYGYQIYGLSTIKPESKVQESKKIPQAKNISTKLLFTGNIYLSRYINDWAMASPLKYAYPFSRLNELDRESYNGWIGGLECPMKANYQQTSAQEDATLTFNCSPNYLPELSKWFNVVTLANNHTDNMGEDGFQETKKHLSEAGIQFFGYYDPRVVDDVCDVISIPVDVLYDDGVKKQGKLPIAMCGWVGVFRVPPNESIQIMQKYSTYMPVIAMPHMGKEYVPAPDEIKTNLYRSMIDNGADMVLGDHPHWVQTTESYKGRLIVYSMGNFMFDQQFNTEVTRSAAIKVVIESDVNNSEDIEKWLELGNNCDTYKDTCLDRAMSQNLNKLKLTYKFDVVGTDNSGKITHLATESTKKSILQRLNWDDTMTKLVSPYQKM